ncbi:ascus development protein [Colletotrichum truncatum]|uniref:Ascus development protein n=1 Tax=Colletotrichum truncatum TaxID=5467 RepID=A0ACC3YNX5_COLTU
MAGLTIRSTPGVMRLYFLCLYFGIGASVWGYNIGILSSILVHPGWKDALGYPSPSIRGTIAGVYYLGTLISYIFVSHPVSDWLGRRYAALSGTLVVCIGALLQALSGGATARATMIFGRMISGVGVAIVSTSVPLYQAEISPAKKRGHFVTMNHVGFIAGIATGLWVGYGMRYWKSEAGIHYGWRLSIILEIIPALIFGIGLPWIPETPRWLVENGKKDRARSTLRWLREGSYSDEQIEQEFGAIVKNIDEYHRSGKNWLSLFKERALFARLWRAALLQFMAQACGATSMKYYLPSLLEALGVEVRVALMAGAIEMTIKIGFTVLEMFIIDRFGRRNCLVAGCAVMAFSMLINGALPIAYPNNVSKVADVICIIFIFTYALGFSLGFGPAAWVYNTEIFPTSVRARGLNFAAAGGSIASILVTEIWPVGISALGSKVYFFFMAVNLICIPVLFAFYPETKGWELEDMDALFGSVERRQTDHDGLRSLDQILRSVTNCANVDLSEHLLRDDAQYRDSEESAAAATRDRDRDLSLIQ